MLAWIRRLLGRFLLPQPNPTPALAQNPEPSSLPSPNAHLEPDIDLYSPQERFIYRYVRAYDPHRNPVVAEVDPLQLWKAVMDEGPDLSTNIKVSTSESKGARVCHDELITQIRRIFGIPSYEEGGLTELECVNLLNHFLTYVGLEKKNTPIWPTSSSPEEVADLPEPSEPSSTEPPATGNSSDSGSTEAGPETNKPQP